MSDALGIAVSGLADQSLRVANAANNLANVSSTNADGSKYKGKDVVSSANASGGVSSQVVERTDGDGVDPAAEIVTMKEASISYQADAKVIKVQDEMQKSLLDTIA